MKPKRIQRKRSKGWRMPPGVIYVGRGSKWGNPFSVDKSILVANGTSIQGSGTYVRTNEEAVYLYRMFIRQRISDGELDITELRGKDLACWCRLDQVCHADVLLELANQE